MITAHYLDKNDEKIASNKVLIKHMLTSINRGHILISEKYMKHGQINLNDTQKRNMISQKFSG